MRTLVLGYSAHGRAIRAVELGDPDERRKLLVVGCIHGDERAGIAIARLLERAPRPVSADLWVIEDLNPDGAAANSRVNGRGVDLNRNFPWHWQFLGPPGTLHYAGARALSEPESRVAYALVQRLHPAVTIWFHQPLAVVDESGGSLAVERRFASLVGLPIRRLPRYPGSAASWQDAALPGTSAFVVELPPGRLSTQAATRYAAAVLRLAAG